MQFYSQYTDGSNYVSNKSTWYRYWRTKVENAYRMWGTVAGRVAEEWLLLLTSNWYSTDIPTEEPTEIYQSCFAESNLQPGDFWVGHVTEWSSGGVAQVGLDGGVGDNVEEKKLHFSPDTFLAEREALSIAGPEE